MTRHDKAVEELNREKGKHFINIGKVVTFSVFAFFWICLAVVKHYEDWIDSKSQFVGVFMVCAGLLSFSVWALWLRKK
jgi:hypothetical protein